MLPNSSVFNMTVESDEEALKRLSIHTPRLSKRSLNAVGFRRTPAENSLRVKILQYLQDHGEINSDTIREKFNPSPTNMRKTVERMKKYGEIEFAAIWRLKAK